MYHGTVLYIRVVTDGYRMHIAPHNGVEPNGAVVSHHDFPNYGRIVCQKTIVPKLRLVSAYSFYQGHISDC
jgi:hypothetical protein